MFEGCSSCCLSIILTRCYAWASSPVVVIYAATATPMRRVQCLQAQSRRSSGVRPGYQRCDYSGAQSRLVGAQIHERDISSWMAPRRQGVRRRARPCLPFQKCPGRPGRWRDALLRRRGGALPLRAAQGLHQAGGRLRRADQPSTSPKWTWRASAHRIFVVQTIKAQFEDVLIPALRQTCRVVTFCTSRVSLWTNGTFEVQGVIRP